jgi:hypothetical protein
MQKTMVLFFLLYIGKITLAQQVKEMYVAYSTGVNMRKTPSLKAELLGKIPYATKLKIDASKKDTSFLSIEGLYGYWVPVSYNNKTGWVLDCYLVALVPPKKGTKKMEDYLAQITTKFGTVLQKANGNMNVITESGNKQTKQLYKNGAQHNTYAGYEYYSDTYVLPNVTMQEAFLLLRQIEEFAMLFTEKTDFPTTSKQEKRKLNNGETEFTYKITKESFGNYDWIKKIEIEFQDGASYNFQMFQLENDVVILFGGGV